MEEIEDKKNIIERKREQLDVNMMNPLVWAYIGDSVYELFIRMKLVNETKLNPHKLHIGTIKYVRAKAQADALSKIYETLTEEEKEIVRRGRNAQSHHLPKNVELVDYKHATAFEALIGYLYLSKQDSRLKKILNMCIKS